MCKPIRRVNPFDVYLGIRGKFLILFFIYSTVAPLEKFTGSATVYAYKITSLN